MFLGVIADDITGATDVGSMLASTGVQTTLSVGVPDPFATPTPSASLGAHIVALKSRTAPRSQAVEQSLRALTWLQTQDCQRYYFKYSSTFDSTSQGNIGPVADALLAQLGLDFTIACPALPDNGRTVYRGHLFVDNALLSDSSMRAHPLTPMHDSNLVRILQAQSSASIGLIGLDAVSEGSQRLLREFETCKQRGAQIVVVDAVSTKDLGAIADACLDLPLVTAGSGLARWLPAAYASRGWISLDSTPAELGGFAGASAIVSGSCSAATLRQVEHWRSTGRAALALDAPALLSGATTSQDLLGQALWHMREGRPVLIYSTAAPDQIAALHARWDARTCSANIEQALAHVACGLVAAGVRRLIVAGGETSGSVVEALGVRTLRIGPTIEPGVPWTVAQDRPLLLALKSGNFGTTDFFDKALRMID